MKIRNNENNFEWYLSIKVFSFTKKVKRQIYKIKKMLVQQNMEQFEWIFENHVVDV